MRLAIDEAIRYTAVSALSFVVDILLLFILVHFFGWWYLAAATVSFSGGMLVGYILSVRWVFKHRRLNNKGLEFASFAAIGGVGIAVNTVVITVGVKYLGLNYLVAKCGAAGFTFLWNFVARRQILFVQRRAI